MCLPGGGPPAAVRWRVIEEGWPRYAVHVRPLAAQASVTPAPWGHWLAWLAFLEAVVNDLCAAAWAAAHLQEPAAARCAETALGTITELLAEAGWHLWSEPGRARPATRAERAAAATGDRRPAGPMRGLGAGLP